MSGHGMTLRTKLVAMTAGTIVALIILFAVLLINGKSQMLGDRQDKVRNLVEVAHATVAHYEQEARAGRLSVTMPKEPQSEPSRPCATTRSNISGLTTLTT